MGFFKQILKDNRGDTKMFVSMTSAFVLLAIVITYQTVVSRDSFTPENVLIPTTFEQAQLFPQTLPPINSGYYELWVKDGEWVSVDKFRVSENGSILSSSGDIAPNNTLQLPRVFENIEEARVTISDTPNRRSGSIIDFLQGPLKRDRVAFKLAIRPQKSVDGQYMLASPTDENSFINERSGIWFGDVNQNEPTLSLPQAPEGWVYEGWVELEDNQFLTTGRFKNIDQKDSFAGFSQNSIATPNFPGEDYLFDPPVAVFPGLEFPLDLGGRSVRITMEPDIRGEDPTGQGLFGITLLDSGISSRAVPRRLYNLEVSSEKDDPVATVVFR